MAKMTFIASLRGQEHVLEVDDHDHADGQYTVRLDGEEHTLDARFMPSDITSVLIDGKSYDVDLDRSGHTRDPLDSHLLVHVRGRVVHLEMLEQRRKRLKDMQETLQHHEGSPAIYSPMPGKVVRVLVQQGDRVSHNQGLVVVEAMKMENELRAPKDAVVKRVAAQPGQTVAAEQMLIELA